MAQMNISIPEKLKGWAESRVAEGRYSSTSDYVRDLIRRDEERETAKAREIERLRAAWEEGIASGPAIDAPDDWADQVIARGEAPRRGEADAA
jgi:antitoxin ParD1/3/4